MTVLDAYNGSTSQVSTTRELITPEVAHLYLQSNTANRPLSESNIRLLAAAIRRGEWQLTHQGIAFDQDGVLLDGQHRLLAVVESGVAVEMMVTRGLSSESFAAMDINRRRTAGQAVTMLGGALAGKNGNLQAATARLWHCWVNGLPVKGAASLVTPMQILEILEAHPRMRRSIDFAKSHSGKMDMAPAAFAVSMYLTQGFDPSMDDPWLFGILTGVNLGQGDPRLTLRHVMFNRKAKRLGGEFDALEQVNAYVKARNAFITGGSFKQFRLGGARPTPILTPAGDRLVG